MDVRSSLLEEEITATHKDRPYLTAAVVSEDLAV